MNCAIILLMDVTRSPHADTQHMVLDYILLNDSCSSSPPRLSAPFQSLDLPMQLKFPTPSLWPLVAPDAGVFSDKWEI